MRNELILVVEDDPDSQELVARILRYHHIPFNIAYTAEDALELLQRNRYSCAVFDLALPGMDGWTLLETVQNNPRTTNMPCLAITAYHSAELAIKAVEAGFTAYFPKPFDSGSFVQELQRLLH